MTDHESMLPISCACLILGFEVFYDASQEYGYVVLRSGRGDGLLAVDITKFSSSILLLEASLD